MAGRPSIVPDYVSVILRAIQSTQNDPARLRSLVYDVARLSLGKHVLMSYHQLGSAGLQQHVSDLETAIHQVENLAQKQIEDFSQKKASVEQKETEKKVERKESAADLAAQLLEGQASASDQTAITVRDSFDDAMFDETRSNRAPVVLQPLPPEVYNPRAEILQPLDFRPAFGSGPKRRQADASFGLQLVVAAVIGIAIYVATLIGLENGPGRLSPTAQIQEASATPTLPVSAKARGAGAEALGFPLPRVYGVYAASEGKLYELDPLPLKVPDARVAISAMISTASQVTIPQGNLQFVIFRRDLVSSAPTEVFVRVVARVARELKFNAGGPPTTTNIDGEWAVRSKQYVFRVAPLGDSPEMVTLHPADPQNALSPGRYALVLAGKGYDFTIEGQATDAAQCLERTNVIGGIVYSECSTSSSPLAN
jgi:hypothetical protein